MNLSKETEAFFFTVIEANKGIIYKVAISYCKNGEDRKDLIQEIIIQLWRSFSKYDEQYKLSTWIYRIALNVSISFYRKEKRRDAISQPISESIFSMTENDEPNEINNDLNLLQRFISELKELDRALILLYLDGNSQKEMAEILGLTETNVATKVSRIKSKLRQKFSNIESQ